MKINPAQSPRHSKFQAERGHLALWMMGAPALVFAISIISSLVEPSQSMPTGEAATAGTGMGFAVALLILSALLLARSSTHATVFGSQLPRATSRGVRWALLPLVAMATLGVMTGVGILSAWSSVAFDVVPPGGADMDALAWAQTWPLSHAVSLSLNAGFAEEVLLLALPVAAGAWVWRRFKMPGSEHASLVIGGLAGLAVRSAMHFYQGWTSSVSALLWGGAVLVAYLIWRSVYPLIAAHVIFDVVVAWWAPQTGAGAVINWTLGGVGAVAAVVLFVLERRERSKRARYESQAHLAERLGC